jgi:hypothetical protein
MGEGVGWSPSFNGATGYMVQIELQLHTSASGSEKAIVPPQIVNKGDWGLHGAHRAAAATTCFKGNNVNLIL